jgi:Winged helix DNA-binding domain
VAGAERVLTARELNRALLARQLLLERTTASLPRALERVGGIQAQYAPSVYVGLWSRVEGFSRRDLDRALERRSVVQGTLMRVTIHLVSARDYWPLAIAVRDERRELWLRAHRGEPSDDVLRPAARRLRRALAGEKMSRAEIDALLDKPGSPVVNGLGMYLDLVRVPPSGTWERRRADLYALAEDWIGLAPVGVEDAGELLVRRYLGGFGPAPVDDIRDWAGISKRAIASLVERMRLRRFRDEAGRELLDLPRAPLPDPETPAPVRFLPVWDATLLVHARRTGILPEAHRKRVFNVRTPHSVNTFLVDGAVAGTWRFEKGRIELSPFARLDRATRRSLDEEAERLAELHR